MTISLYPFVRWQEAGVEHSARWRSEAGVAPPESVVVADDTLKADAAYRLAGAGDGDSVARRLPECAPAAAGAGAAGGSQAAQGAEEAGDAGRGISPASPGAGAAGARFLGMLLVPLTPITASRCAARRMWRAACVEAYGPGRRGFGGFAARTAGAGRRARVAQEGRAGAGGGGRIYPHYGVFSPVRGEYVDLVAKAPLPARL